MSNSCEVLRQEYLASPAPEQETEQLELGGGVALREEERWARDRTESGLGDHSVVFVGLLFSEQEEATWGVNMNEKHDLTHLF